MIEKYVIEEIIWQANALPDSKDGIEQRKILDTLDSLIKISRDMT